MKNPRCVFVFLAVMGLAGLALGAGCGSDAAPAAVPDPISVNTLDGSEGVPVDSTFKYAFPRPMITSAVTKSTFFIVKNEVSSSLNKAVVDGGICDSTQALDISVGCSSPSECTLTPAELLEYSSVYSICLTGNMQYDTGEQFGDFMATFTAEVEGPLDLNNLDGAVDVPVDSSFRYRFLKEIDTSTVDTSTYFIVPTPAAESASINKADVVPEICNSDNAVASEITCTRWSCTIAPSAYLEYITGYTACLASGISYTSSFTFNGFMASFTTSEWIISSIKLVRLDDTELDLTDRPIPRMVLVKYSFSSPLSDEVRRAEFEEAVQLLDPDNIAVDGSWTWAEDFSSATFTPNHQFEYRTEYTINVDTSILPLLSLSKALENQDLNFTTMTEKDINGDGFADVIVGAFGYPSLGWGGRGRAYIYLGSASGIADCDLTPTSTCVPDTTITGGIDGDRLGNYTVSNAGDVNADGYADVIVSASGYDSGGGITNNGRAYIFLGSASGIADCDLTPPSTCVPDTTITGENTDDALGNSVSAADVNGDGYDDVIVAAQAYPSGANKGRAYIFLGSANGIDDCDLSAGYVAHATITGEYNADRFGWSAPTAGDINADGYADVVVGAFSYNGDDDDLGRAYVFLGGSTLSGNLQAADADAIITGENNNDFLGGSVSAAGDVNADGYDDIIVGARGVDSIRGRAYVFLGSAAGIGDCDLSDPACIPHATITGENTGDMLLAVSNAGDVNADGYDDVIVGAYYYPSPDNKGRAYIFLGGSTLSGNLGAADADAIITGENNDDNLGEALNAGDVDGDGYADVIIGASGYPSGGWANGQGRAYIFMGSVSSISDCNMSAPTSCTADTTLTGENGKDKFGYSVN